MIAARLSLYYGAMFLMIGIHLPFWPLWLTSRGLTAEEIGLILAAGIGTKVVFNPLAAHFADRFGERKRIIVALTLASFFAFLLFRSADGFWPLFAVTVLFFALWSPNMPLVESLTMQSGRSMGFQYGRIRLWGSITFIVSAILIGYLLKDRPEDLVFTAIAATLVLTAAAAWLLPDIRSPAAESGRFTLFAVLSDRRFVLFLAGAALIQASHAVYYGFGTIHWRNSGLSEEIIGALWAEGVIAEIVLFIFGARVVGRVGPARLIALAGLLTCLRWVVTAGTTSLSVLVIVQALHAFSYGAAHLGAMHFIQSRIDPALSATAQSLYASLVMGLAMGGAAYAAGHLYAAHAGGAYLFMAGMAAFGGAIVFLLRRRG